MKQRPTPKRADTTTPPDPHHRQPRRARYTWRQA